MDLSRNKIHCVEKDAFMDFVHLTDLHLSENYISVVNLREAFGSLSEKLENIWLHTMELTDLPEDFFAAFHNRTFSVVNLHNNSLTVLDSAVFAVFWRVKKLDVSENKIGALRLLKQARVNMLKLEWNVFKSFPVFCLQDQGEGNEWENKSVDAFIDLQDVYLGHGMFASLPAWTLRGQCLPNLRTLDIGGARKMTTLEDNFIADLPKLKVLRIYNMRELKYYRRYSLNSTSLTEVFFCNNKELRNKPKQRTVSLQLFKYCPNLEVLNIEQMGVKLKSSEFRRLLLPLKSLRNLKLNSIRMASIPPNLLCRLPKLENLSFTGNGLTSYGLGQALIKARSLKFLNVQGNGITVVNETTLPWEFRQNVKMIDLSHNPFTCTCELLWFRKWLDDVIHNKSIIVKSFTYKKERTPSYMCKTPENMRYKPLHQFSPTEESCAIRNPYFIIGAAIGCFVVMVTVVGVLCYRYRWHLRYYVYRLRRSTWYMQGFNDPSEGGGEVIHMYKYDVYLAHSTQDVEWIMQELLPLLEGEHGLQVFLEERNAIGGSVGDNIPRYMDESARVMLVVSDNYNREGWRQYEFEHILYATFEQHKDVIVLLLGDAEAGRMTKDMRRMLTRGTFLQWDPGEDAKRLFRNGLKVALRTQDVGHHNLC